MAQTTPREALTCLAFSYFAEERSNADLQDFSDVVYDFYFNNKKQAVKQYKSNLPSNFNFDRIKDFYTTKDDALKKDGKYQVGQYKKDYPNGTLKQNEAGQPNKLDGEIKSAYLSAEKLANSTIMGNMSQYIFFDQSTEFMKVVKDDSLEKTLKALDLPENVGSDILSSVDVIAVKRSKVREIQKDFEDNIINVDTLDVLNNLAWGKTGKNTFRTLTNKYFDSKDMVEISLKKTSPTRADVSIIGTISGASGELIVNLDPYTEFLSRAAACNSQRELYDLISDLVEIEDIDDSKIADGRTYFSIIYTLNYKKVNITDKMAKFDLQIGRTGFNAKPYGKGAFVGGASYAITTPIMKKYSKYNTLLSEMIGIRTKAFNAAVKQSRVPSRLRVEYNNALREVRKRDLVLYDDSANKIIKTFCMMYDDATRSNEDSFQRYRINVSKLCKNKTLSSPDGNLARLDKESMLKNKKEILQNDYVHAQGLWIYTRKNRDIQNFFKKQITLSIYGLMAKKGAKVFLSSRQSAMIEDAFVKEFKSKNGRTKLAKFATAPYVLID